jgi:uncharacterized RDD family membrane protein YckC
MKQYPLAGQPHNGGTPAGFLVRLAAFALDYIPIAGYVLLLLAAGIGVNRRFPNFQKNLITSPLVGEALGFLLVTLPVTLYYTFGESSPRKATWGKQKMALQVVDAGGRRLHKSHALARSALKFIPWEMAHAAIWQGALGKGFESTVFTIGISLTWVFVGANILSMVIGPERQTLYDRMAGTRVIRTLH